MLEWSRSDLMVLSEPRPTQGRMVVAPASRPRHAFLNIAPREGTLQRTLAPASIRSSGSVPGTCTITRDGQEPKELWRRVVSADQRPFLCSASCLSALLPKADFVRCIVRMSWLKQLRVFLRAGATPLRRSRRRSEFWLQSNALPNAPDELAFCGLRTCPALRQDLPT